MSCARHPGAVYVRSVNDSKMDGGHAHFYDCGCHGTAEQLRDPAYDPNPPSAESLRIAELEAEVAELQKLVKRLK